MNFSLALPSFGMIRVIFTKELREHLTIWIALALTFTVVMLGVPQFYPPGSQEWPFWQELLIGLSATFVYVTGLVCGATLLAGEREAKTDAFLDLLPVSRMALWISKCIAGTVFLSLYTGLVLALGYSQGIYESQQLAILVLPISAYSSFAWGMVTSARYNNVLTAIGAAIGLQILMSIFSNVVGIFSLLTFSWAFGVRMPLEIVMGISALFLFVFCPLPLSALIYARVDFTRIAEKGSSPRPTLSPATSPPPTRPQSAWREQVRAILWLVHRQCGYGLWALLLLAGMLGVCVAAQGLYLWPLATLLIGLICGATMFFDEQQGAFFFLRSQRIPLRVFWWVKSLHRLCLALVALLFVLIAPIFRLMFDSSSIDPNNDPIWSSTLARLFHSPLLATTVPTMIFLFGPVLSGLTFGQLASMIFRKPLMAFFFGGAFSVGYLLLWIPSILVGGLAGWQFFGVLIIVWFLASWSLRDAVSDTLLMMRSLTRFICAAILCVMLITAALAWRVFEMPDPPEPAGLAAYRAEALTPEQDRATTLTRSILSRIGSLRNEIARLDEPRRPQGGAAPGEVNPGMLEPLGNQIHRILNEGWPTEPNDDTTLADFLDRSFQNELWADFFAASKLATSRIENPRQMMLNSPLTMMQPTRDCINFLELRALQLQAKGDDAAFLRLFEAGLALARNAGSDGGHIQVATAAQLEIMLLRNLQLWLTGLNNNEKLLVEALSILTKHQQASQIQPDRVACAEYTMLLRTLDAPGTWAFAGAFRAKELEILGAIVQVVPWERERVLRIARGKVGEAYPNPNVLLWERLLMLQSWRTSLQRVETQRQRCIDFSRTALAIRAFQAKNQRMPKTLHILVPNYLNTLPDVNYRQAEEGEAWPSPHFWLDPEDRVLCEGQAVLSATLENRSYVVPWPASKKKQ
jgi:hypothetical protein